MLTITKPKKMNTLAKLAEFEAILDKHLFDTRPDDEDENPVLTVKNGVKTAAGVGAAAGAYVGGKKLKNAVTNRYGVTDDFGKTVATGDMIKKGIKKDAGDLASRGKSYAKKVGGEVAKVGDYFKSARAGATEGLGSGIVDAAKSAGKRVLRGVASHGFSGVAAKIVELDAISDKIIELRAKRY